MILEIDMITELQYTTIWIWAIGPLPFSLFVILSDKRAKVLKITDEHIQIAFRIVIYLQKYGL